MESSTGTVMQYEMQNNTEELLNEPVTDDLCRICATSNQYMTTIFEGEGLENSLGEKINSLLPISVSKEDEFTHFICYQCASHIIAWYDLRECAINTDIKFRNSLKLLNEQTECDQETALNETVTVTQMEQMEMNADEENGENATFEEGLMNMELRNAVDDNQPNTVYSEILLVPSYEYNNIGINYNEDLEKGDLNLNIGSILVEEVDDRQDNELENGVTNNVITESIVNKPTEIAQYYEIVNEDQSDIINSIIETEGDLSPSKQLFLNEAIKNFTTDSIAENNYEYEIISEEKTVEGVPELYIYNFSHEHQINQNLENNSEMSEQSPEEGSTAENDTMIIQNIAEETVAGDAHLNLFKEDFDNSTNAEIIYSNNFDENYIENPSLYVECITSADEDNNLLADLSKTSIHTCTYCNKAYRSISQLVKHQVLCRNRMQADKQNLTGHKKQIHRHTDTGRFQCPHCVTTCLNKRILRTHLKIHTSPMSFQCEICHKNFRRKSNMENHHATHVNDFPCVVCCNSYNTEFHLSRHLAQHPEDLVNESASNPSYVICDFKDSCGEKFYSKLKYYIHKKSHLNIVDYKCDKCNKTYKSEAILANHKKTHEASRTCKDCGKMLSNEKTYKEHLRLHTGEMPFNCKECDHWFRCQSSLAVHMLTHTGVKNYKCMYCQQAFTRSTYLKDHLRTHTDDKPFECQYCNQCYAQSGVMNKHVATMHRKCNLCDEIVGDKTKLQVHMWKVHASKDVNYSQNIDKLLLNENQILVGEEIAG